MTFTLMGRGAAVSAATRFAAYDARTPRWNRWHLVQLTPAAALEHDRRVHNCGPGVGLGWVPYTFRATRGAVAQFACHDEDELRRRLAGRGLAVVGWSEWRDGIRTTYLEEVS